MSHGEVGDLESQRLQTDPIVDEVPQFPSSVMLWSSTLWAVVLFAVWMAWPDISKHLNGLSIFWFVALCTLVWAVHLTVLVEQADTRRDAWAVCQYRLGVLSKQNLWACTQLPALLVGVETLLLALINPTAFRNWHLYIVAGLYPLWALVQQFWCQSILTANIYELLDHYVLHAEVAEWRLRLLSSFIGGVFFALGHARSDYRLLTVTFFLGPLWSWLFLKYRQLLPLAVFHGIGGSLFYFCVLQQDPLHT